MQIEQNKQIVQKFWSLFEYADVDNILSMISHDAVWIVKGNEQIHSSAGQKSKEQMAEIWKHLFQLLEGGLTMEVLQMTAEKNRVAATIRANAHTKTGKIYNNEYLMLLTLDQQKVIEVVEYTDLAYAKVILG